MENTLKLVGKSSNEIFTLRYPYTLVDFCEFDFSFFAQEAIEVCNEALKTGSPDFDKISEIKKDMQSAHCYMQYSTRTTYDKIVFDCWIDYVCRRDNIGNSALWNRFIRCKTPFEKIIFSRLCDFRYKRAVNEWLNVIRIQDYAKTKVRFVFSEGIKSADAAEERKNYFDLMFSVTAKELGCRLDDIGVTKYYSIGRTPGAPFLFPSVSKEIVRHVLAGFDYSDDYSDITDYTENADEVAMDAFSRMKAGLPQDLSAYTIPTGKLENLSDRIYMPCGLKAVVDLEIDAMIESGMWLIRCKNCGRYFGVTKDDYKEYCTRRNMPSGKTCIQIYEEQNPRPKLTEQLAERCKAVMDEMYSRVDNTMSIEEYNSWRSYLEAMKQKVENGEISPSELENFLEYSRDVDITKSNPIVEVPKREPDAPKERVVRPFVPERISRSELQQYEPRHEYEEAERSSPKPPREGFFTSPSVQRQKSERPQISHIIRNGEPLGDNGGLSANVSPAGFQPFEPQYQVEQPPVQKAVSSEKMPKRSEPRIEREQAYDNLRRLEERLEQERKLREERNTFKPLVEQDKVEFVEDYPNKAPQPARISSRESTAQLPRTSGRFTPDYPQYESPNSQTTSRIIRDYDGESMRSPREKSEIPQNRDASAPVHHTERPQPHQTVDEAEQYQQPHQAQPKQTSEPVKAAEQPDSRPKVIKKNAAAISAYGKMSGQSIAVSPENNEAAPRGDYSSSVIQQQEEVSYPSRPVQSAQRESFYTDRQDTPYQSEAYQSSQLDPDMLEPFKDIGSIFDVLEQSETQSSRRTREPYYSAYDYDEDDLPKRMSSGKESVSSEYGRDIIDSVPTQAELQSESRKQRVIPERPIRNDEVPSGIWTEDRGLFRDEPMPMSEEMEEVEEYSQPEKTEIETIRERRHTRSSKTQRLYDVIMREPDDNPNFRKKR